MTKTTLPFGLEHRPTQCEKVLKLLECGEWVPAYKLADVALQYNARVFQLRRAGWDIRNRTEEVNGVRHSWFRLVREKS